VTVLSPTEGPYWEITAGNLKAAKFGPDGRFWVLDDDGLHEATPQGKTNRAVWQNDPEWAPKGLQLRSLAAGRRWVFVGRRDGMVIRVDPATGAATQWALLKTPVDGLALSPDETQLLVGGESGEVRLVDVATGVPTVIPDAHRSDVPATAFGKHMLVTGSADRRVRLWTAQGQPVATLRMQGPVKKVLLSDDESSLLVLVEGERAVRRWKLDVLFREWTALGIAVPGW
jgi:WD40 repeat protein